MKTNTEKLQTALKKHAKYLDGRRLVSAHAAKWKSVPFEHIHFEQLTVPLNFAHADLTDCKFSDLRFIDADFTAAWLFTAHFRYCYFQGCTFDWATMQQTEFKYCRFENCKMQNIIASAADFAQNTFIDCDLRAASFHKADLSDCALRDCNFNEANFHRANLYSVRPVNCSFAHANLREANTAAFNTQDCDLILGGQDNRGHLFFATKHRLGYPIIKAGCREFYGFKAAYAHWNFRHEAPLRADCLSLLDRLAMLAEARGWRLEPKQTTEQILEEMCAEQYVRDAEQYANDPAFR